MNFGCIQHSSSKLDSAFICTKFLNFSFSQFLIFSISHFLNFSFSQFLIFSISHSPH